MRAGNAPFVARRQAVGARRTYELHHVTPIDQGGGVYDLDNLMITTPRFHQEALHPEYHYR